MSLFPLLPEHPTFTSIKYACVATRVSHLEKLLPTEQNMRELRTFRLPQLVEARRKGESASVLSDSPDAAAMGHSLTPSRSSSSSDAPSPVTPTFSMRSHSRYPSSNSSFPSSPTMRESSDGFNSLKRLTEVNEELHERDEDDDRLGQSENQRGCKCRYTSLLETPLLHRQLMGAPPPRPSRPGLMYV